MRTLAVPPCMQALDDAFQRLCLYSRGTDELAPPSEPPGPSPAAEPGGGKASKRAGGAAAAAAAGGAAGGKGAGEEGSVEALRASVTHHVQRTTGDGEEGAGREVSAAMQW